MVLMSILTPCTEFTCYGAYHMNDSDSDSVSNSNSDSDSDSDKIWPDISLEYGEPHLFDFRL